MRTRIRRWRRVELKQLDLEVRIRSFEYEGDVLRFHVRHAHVSGGKATVDRRDMILFEAKEGEELDRTASVCHCDRNVIRIEYHLVAPRHQRRAHGRAGSRLRLLFAEKTYRKARRSGTSMFALETMVRVILTGEFLYFKLLFVGMIACASFIVALDEWGYVR